MAWLPQPVVEFLKSEEGPTAVEYAVQLFLIVVVCLNAISALGSRSRNTFQRVGNSVNVAS